MNSLNNLIDRKGLVRIGVFYDGNYFLHVNNYYNYIHQRKKRLSIGGLHEFIRQQVAHEEGLDVRLCQVVDSHYFRGRLNAQEASARGNLLYFDRVFDDMLMSEGVVTHYLPLKSRGGKKEEKGIDVWLALEAFELTLYKHFNVLVLIASDGDYVPLVRKLNTLGTRVMVLSWDFSFTDDMGREMVTRTSQDLLEEVSYPVAMHELIDNRLRRHDPVVSNLFLDSDNFHNHTAATFRNGVTDNRLRRSTTLNMKDGFGFIAYPPNNLFFHYSDVQDGDFNDIENGDLVEFKIDKNERGQEVAKYVRKINRSEKDYLPKEEALPKERGDDY